MDTNKLRGVMYEYRKTYKLCDEIARDVSNKLLLDRPREVRATKKHLKGFQALIELACRDLGYDVKGRPLEPDGQSEIPDWFEGSRRRSVGSTQEGDDSDRGEDESGQVGIQPVSGETTRGVGQQGDLFQP